MDETEIVSAIRWWDELSENEKASLLRDKPWIGTMEKRHKKLVDWYRVFVSRDQREAEHREYLEYKQEMPVDEEKWNEHVETCSDCGIRWKKIGKPCPVCYAPAERTKENTAREATKEDD
jgi:rubrerythrin